jgi:hypothetical protein
MFYDRDLDVVGGRVPMLPNAPLASPPFAGGVSAALPFVTALMVEVTYTKERLDFRLKSNSISDPTDRLTNVRSEFSSVL